MSRYTITIPDVPPSLNKVLRMHWRAKSRFLDDWEWLVRIGLPVEYERAVDVKQQVAITIHNARTYDKDNAYGACKVILDSLKALGLIVDDSARWLDVDVRQEKSTRKDKHTTIEIGPAEVSA